MTPAVAAKKLSKFDSKTFLSTIDGGRKIAAFPKKRATIGILSERDFFGEGSLTGQPLRLLRNRNDRLLCDANQ
jgi:hypothetical protein